MDDVRTALFALAIWGPVIASLALFAVRASKGISALRTMPTRATVSAGVMLVLLLTALCYTWGYMLLMVADDMVLTGDTSIVTWFMRSGNWHRPHSMIFEAYQLTSLDPVQWWITGQLLSFAIFLSAFFRISASRQRVSHAALVVWLGFMVALSFALPLFAIALFLLPAAATAATPRGKAGTAAAGSAGKFAAAVAGSEVDSTSGGVSALQLLTLAASTVMGFGCLFLLHPTRGPVFNTVLVLGHGALLLPFIGAGWCARVGAPTRGPSLRIAGLFIAIALTATAAHWAFTANALVHVSATADPPTLLRKNPVYWASALPQFSPQLRCRSPAECGAVRDFYIGLLGPKASASADAGTTCLRGCKVVASEAYVPLVPVLGLSRMPPPPQPVTVHVPMQVDGTNESGASPGGNNTARYSSTVLPLPRGLRLLPLVRAQTAELAAAEALTETVRVLTRDTWALSTAPSGPPGFFNSVLAFPSRVYTAFYACAAQASVGFDLIFSTLIVAVLLTAGVLPRAALAQPPQHGAVGASALPPALSSWPARAALAAAIVVATPAVPLAASASAIVAWAEISAVARARKLKED